MTFYTFGSLDYNTIETSEMKQHGVKQHGVGLGIIVSKRMGNILIIQESINIYSSTKFLVIKFLVD